MKNIKAFFICVYNFQHIFDFVKLVTLKYFLPKWTITVNQKTKTEILFTDYIYRYQNSSKKHLNKLLRHWNECTTLPDRRRLIIIIFLLLSKALFQTYWRTAIRWGWSENLLGQAVVLKYCQCWGSNRCPLSWKLGKLPLDQLDLMKLYFEIQF